MNIDLKNNIKNNITNKDTTLISDTTTKNNIINKDQVFKLSKKQDDKANKKVFNVYMDAELQKDLDKLCKRTGYSRNELINLMVQHCIDNVELLD